MSSQISLISKVNTKSVQGEFYVYLYYNYKFIQYNYNIIIQNLFKVNSMYIYIIIILYKFRHPKHALNARNMHFQKNMSLHITFSVLRCFICCSIWLLCSHMKPHIEHWERYKFSVCRTYSHFHHLYLGIIYH